MNDRVLGTTHPAEPDRPAQGEEAPAAETRADVTSTGVPASTDDTAPSHRPPVPAEPSAPEYFTVAEGATSGQGDSEATRVMSPSDRLAALVAQTRIRTGRYTTVGGSNVSTGSGPIGAAPAPQIIGEADPTERSQSPLGDGSAKVPTSSGQLGAGPAPQALGEAELTEKSQSPDEHESASALDQPVSLEEDPTLGTPGVVPSKGGFLWKAGVVVVLGGLVWFAVAQVLPRYRVVAGDSGAAFHETTPPTAAIRQAPTIPAPPAAEPSPANTEPPTPPPTPAEPVAGPADSPAERPRPARTTDRTKPVGATSPRPSSHAHSRSKAKAGARPARSLAADPDATLAPDILPPQTEAPDSSARHKIKTTTKRP